MNKKFSVAAFSFALLFSLFFLSHGAARAQENLDAIGIAEIFQIEDADAAPGDIVTLDSERFVYRLADAPNDSGLVGVIAERPLLLFRTGGEGQAVVRTGQAEVNVTTANGPIRTGDFITSSSIRGKGQRFVKTDEQQSPYIIGVALERFPSAEGVGTAEGSILVDLAIGTLPTNEQLEKAEALGEGVEIRPGAGLGETKTAIQYLVAAALALGSIYFAFHNFGTSIQNGIVSIGRNPRAKTPIQITVFFHLFVILAISAGGIFLSLVILRLTLF